MSKDQLILGIQEAAAKGWRARKQNLSDAQQEFVDLIQRMVVTGPSARLNIAEVLAHPWLRREA